MVRVTFISVAFIAITCICCLATLRQINASKILCLFPSPSRSHLIIASSLMKALADHGHDVTMISSFPLEVPVKNYRDIVLPKDTRFDEMQNKLSELSSTSMFMNFFTMFDLVMSSSNVSMSLPQVQRVMNEEKFDLVIVGFFLTLYQLGVAAHFGCPVIVLSTIGQTQFVSKLVGNPLSVSTVPQLLLSGYTEPMTFVQRVKNMVATTLEFMFTEYIDYRQYEYYNHMFPADKYPSYDVVKRNVSMVFINNHMSQGVPRPYVPNMIEIGGIQIKSKPNPLPGDLEQWMNASTNGVILFTLGSNVKLSKLPDAKLAIIFRALAKFPHNVLIKWEADVLPNKPANVRISKWLPQDDILAHPNTKLFISHCGLSSVNEAKYHGVPIVGLPVMGDQRGNAEKAVADKWALMLDLAELNDQNFYAAIAEVLYNSTYAATVQRISSLYRDRPMSAVDTAIYWVEYVIRHKGAHHLRSPGAALNLLQLHSIDVIVFIVAALVIVNAIVWLLMCKIKKCICRRSVAGPPQSAKLTKKFD